MQTNFLDISYLKEGNPVQQRSYELLVRYKVFPILSSYHPVLVGTIPIEIDIEGSDLDIVCEIEDMVSFQEYLLEHFGNFPDFRMKNSNGNLVVCNFCIEEMLVEIYASESSSTSSNGYQHMLIEHRILNLLGGDFKRRVIELKTNGIKTEPAFGQLLGLRDNPYEELLKLKDYSDSDIQRLWSNSKGL